MLDAATHFGRLVRPTEGDVTICLNCGACNIFAEGMRLEAFDESKLDAESAAEVARYRAAIAKTKGGSR